MKVLKAQTERITRAGRLVVEAGSGICLEKCATAAVVSDMTAFLPGVKYHSYSWEWCSTASGSRELQASFFSPGPSLLNIFWQNILSLFPTYSILEFMKVITSSTTAFRIKSHLQSCLHSLFFIDFISYIFWSWHFQERGNLHRDFYVNCNPCFV